MIVRNAQVLADVSRTTKDQRAIFVTFGSLDAEATIDLLIQQRLYQFGQLRSIFIDTSDQAQGSNGCTIETDSGQTIKAATGTQGYYTVFVPFVSKLTIIADDAVNLILFDRDIAPIVWELSAQSNKFVGSPSKLANGVTLASAAKQTYPNSNNVNFIYWIGVVLNNYSGNENALFLYDGNGTQIFALNIPPFSNATELYVFSLLNYNVVNVSGSLSAALFVTPTAGSISVDCCYGV